MIVGGVGEGGGEPVGVVNWGAFEGIRAYTIGTATCNRGDAPVSWTDCFNPGDPTCAMHPVMAQHLYRLLNGRFEQIGQSWVRHGFCALSTDYCEFGCQPTNCDTLGIGCSTYNSSGVSGQASNLGPKSDVNAATGVFPFPSAMYGSPMGSSVIRGRLQVYESDLGLAGARYYAELHNIAADDAATGHGRNNASHRRIAFSGSSFNPSFPDGTGSTIRELPAIFAWRDDLVAGDPLVTLLPSDVPGDGRFWLGYRATDLGGGLWHYEYAAFNLSSHRSGRSFSVPVQPGVSVSNVGFHDVDYHSGEPPDGVDWAVAVGGGAIIWETQVWTAENDLSANALRWGTLYNFRFDADSPPVDADATLGLFRPGEPASMALAVVAPAAPACAYPGDVDGSGVVDERDIPVFVEMFLGIAPVDACAELSGPGGAPLDMADVEAFVGLLVGGAGCS